MAETPPEIQALSYEDALKELEALIRKLESGSVDLADSIASYERGAALAAHCSRLLEATEQKVERLVLGPDGKPTEEPLPSLGEEEELNNASIPTPVVPCLIAQVIKVIEASARHRRFDLRRLASAGGMPS